MLQMSMPELVDQATAYVKELQQNLEKYKQMKVEMKLDCSKRSRKISPVLNITDSGSHLEVNLITGLNNQFALSDFISILQEEGAEIISATCQCTEDRATYTILSQAVYPRIGIATSSVLERLKRLIC
ncbi:Non-LTR retroelement reverse transcriptase-like protein [Hibiscus syriacus]|uniref:Non-LTR retroelement reverse transcriptase-like protein n=1 Tax=Hibiscus syriacus TaxID=106335 RepID=A0A6A2WRF7_HIBSY|nr:Non-LTR retroelement reverse transcriptase-like protein [Hibiscus syriacus]